LVGTTTPSIAKPASYDSSTLGASATAVAAVAILDLLFFLIGPFFFAIMTMEACDMEVVTGCAMVAPLNERAFW